MLEQLRGGEATEGKSLNGEGAPAAAEPDSEKVETTLEDSDPLLDMARRAAEDSADPLAEAAAQIMSESADKAAHEPEADETANAVDEMANASEETVNAAEETVNAAEETADPAEESAENGCSIE